MPVSSHSPKGTMLQVRSNTAWIGWLALLTFLPFALYCWNQGSQGRFIAAIPLFFAVSGICLITNITTLRVDDEWVECESRFSKHRIAWNEIIGVHTNRQGTSLIFLGQDKSLQFADPGLWKKEGRSEMMQFLAVQCEERGLPWMTFSPQLGSASKNTKVTR